MTYSCVCCSRLNEISTPNENFTHPDFGFVAIWIGNVEEHAIKISHHHVNGLRLVPDLKETQKSRQVR